MPLDELRPPHPDRSGGGAVADPASVYFGISKDTNDTVERATQVFCGVRMLCARCHTHPLENWTQADYYGLASFFNQVSVRADVQLSERAEQQAGAGEPCCRLGDESAHRPAAAAALPGRRGWPKLAADVDPPRRPTHARWLTASENPFFARGLVNRFWSYFFHRGIVEPVDDVRSTNPPINPALLDALTRDFVAHHFDVRHLMRQGS